MNKFYGTLKFKLAIAAVIVILSTCLIYLNINRVREDAKSSQTIAASQNNSSNVNSQSTIDETSVEKDYIKSVHESAITINFAAEQLKPLLSNINVDDPTWHSDVSIALRKINSALGYYTNNEIKLSTIESKSKYDKTMEIFDKGIKQFQSITKSGQSALDTYDKKKLEEIAPLLDPANEQIKKGLEQLEIDRYQK